MLEVQDGSRISEQSQEMFRSLLRRPMATRAMLEGMVTQYATIVETVLEDPACRAAQKARQVASGLLLLLGTCTLEELPLVQAAALYFTSDEDAVPDTESDDGFDDDAAVFNAVCRSLGREDLVLAM